MDASYYEVSYGPAKGQERDLRLRLGSIFSERLACADPLRNPAADAKLDGMGVKVPVIGTPASERPEGATQRQRGMHPNNPTAKCVSEGLQTVLHSGLGFRHPAGQ
ncbi:hypothetical protein FF011L_25060 [Roseimaritima multifibrata]|uniref:Uncharacterized protein n=1 Tax=Roseimaritima multifibrata TaxID=1930274 RepID=A0A517MFS2_9BACT|nr:hypothetical protein FF011L_25060 [Roseimaritima multifibrata]